MYDEYPTNVVKCAYGPVCCWSRRKNWGKRSTAAQLDVCPPMWGKRGNCTYIHTKYKNTVDRHDKQLRIQEVEGGGEIAKGGDKSETTAAHSATLCITPAGGA